MGKMIEWFKAHPLAAGLIVFGVGLIFVIALFGGSSGSAQNTVVTDAPSDVGANSALVAAQLNASSQIAAATINANVNLAAIDAAKSVQNTQTNAQVTAIQVQADTSKYIATLQATNDAAGIQAAKDINAANLTAAQAIAVTQSSADTTIANIYAQVATSNNDVVKYQTDAGKSVAMAQIDANKYALDKTLAYKLTMNNTILGFQQAQNFHAIDNASAVNWYALSLGQGAPVSAAPNLLYTPLV